MFEIKSLLLEIKPVTLKAFINISLYNFVLQLNGKNKIYPKDGKQLKSELYCLPDRGFK